MAILIAACCLWLVTATDALAAAKVTGIYFATKGDGTVATFTMEGDITRHRAYTAENPDRLVIDIDNGEWDVPGNAAIGRSPLVKSIRSGSPGAGMLRIVMELNRKAEVLSDNRTDTTLAVQFASINTPPTPEEKPVTKLPEAPAPAAPVVTPAPKPLPEVKTTAPASRYAKPGEVPKSMQKNYKGKVLPSVDDIATRGKKHSAADKPQTGRKPVIVIDAGHGGTDPGAIGKSGMYEKKVTLQYALALQKRLEATGRYKVYLTRKGDRFVSLEDRVKKARGWKGDLFISLHADSASDSSTRGLSVYTISEDRAARETDKLVTKASATEVIRGVDMKGDDKDVQTTLLDFARRANTNIAATFAEMLVKEMGNDAQLLDNTHRSKSLAVLTDIDITSVLIELGYLSNKQEEKQLKTEDYRTTITYGIARAVDGYFEKFPLEN